VQLSGRVHETLGSIHRARKKLKRGERKRRGRIKREKMNENFTF
jgi:hypothetical protein